VYRLLAISKAAREGRVQDLPAGQSKGDRSAKWNNEWADILSIYAQLGHEVNSKREVEKLLQRFVASDVADQLLNGNEVLQLGGEVVEASVLFVDIVEYTRMSELMSPDEVARMLNKYLSIFTSCARIYHGTVDKFIGDAAMIVFGAPRADKDHRLQAMSCANAIRLVARKINQKREAKGLNQINLRVGVNSGLMQAGILGSEYRMEYTVVGDAVNLASRLCDAAQPGEALVSESVYNNGFYSEVNAENAGLVAVKGKDEMVNVYRIQAVNEPKGWMLAGLIEDLVSAH
jgi:adenylate cyclase